MALAIMVMVFYLWVTEAVELPVASMLLLVLAPLTGIMTFRETAEPFAHPIIFLLMGGFILGISFEKWNLHRRISLLLINKVGFSPRRIILSFMIATSFLSMWISNTATTIIMLPISLSIIQLLKGVKSNSTKDVKTFAKALTISIAFSATLGGNGTL
ncbi:SLC13 family permease, partial [Bacteroidota bacterium]